jgi:hypothetical protein
VFSFRLSRLYRGAEDTGDDGKRANAERRSCSAARGCEAPLSFSELIAASSFLDFGGTLDERRLPGREREESHTDWRRKEGFHAGCKSTWKALHRRPAPVCQPGNMFCNPVPTKNNTAAILPPGA